MKKRLLKIGGAILGVIIIGLVALVLVAYLNTQSRFNKVYAIDVADLVIATDEATIAEGERLFFSRGCADCHGDEAQGELLIDDPFIGTVYTANLTRGKGGLSSDYTTADFVRAIRHGVGKDGKPLMVMPSAEFSEMSDADLSAIIAYMQSLPPVDNEMPAPRVGVGGRVLVMAGMFKIPAEEIDHDNVQPSTVEVAASVEFGEYLAVVCTGCHQADFGGGKLPTGLVVPNITPSDDGIGHYELEDFVRAMREGVRPDGSALSTDMPWQNIGRMTDTELEALWLYLQSVEPISNDD